MTLVLINLDTSQLRAAMPSFVPADSHIDTYVFTSGDTGRHDDSDGDGVGGDNEDGVSSWSTRLNGEVLALTQGGQLPPMPPARSSAGNDLVLPPQSVTLAVVGGAGNVPACN